MISAIHQRSVCWCLELPEGYVANNATNTDRWAQSESRTQNTDVIVVRNPALD